MLARTEETVEQGFLLALEVIQPLQAVAGGARCITAANHQVGTEQVSLIFLAAAPGGTPDIV
ncbi:hypothetical protein D3C72_2509460 [compost metagenome]